MKEFKSIITHPEGQNLFPGQITAIEGYPQGTSITMKNTKPQIALTPYGASYMMPNMDYKFAGNMVAELPTAQAGGQDQQQQLMQLIQTYAQMKGMKPEELIQKIQSLPKDQQQQALQSIAQEVQQAMAQQQGAEQQEAQAGQQDQEGAADQQGEMMEEGGEPCFDCFDHYNPSPQAQDLNWYYKATGGEAFPQAAVYPHMYAQGGEAFPQANTYPEDWASYHGNQYMKGGEAFPQAQTYLPYDRAGETRPNFMFETGGQSSIDDIYQIMKKGGVDYNPSKKKGGKFDHVEEFQKYLEKGGGLKKYQVYNSITGMDDQPPYNNYYPSPSVMWDKEHIGDQIGDIGLNTALEYNNYGKAKSINTSPLDNPRGNYSTYSRLSGNYPNTGQYFNTPGNVPYNQRISAGDNFKFIDYGQSPSYGFRDPNTDRYTYEKAADDSNDWYNITDHKTGKITNASPGISPGNKAGNAILNIDPDYNMTDAPSYDYSKIAGNPPPAPAAAPASTSSTSSAASGYGNYVPVPSNYRDQTPSGDNEFDWNKYGRGWYSKKAQRDFDAGMGKGWGTEYQKPMSAADQLKGQEKQMKKYLRKSMRRGLDLNPTVDALNMGAAMTGNKGLFGALAAVGNLGRTVSDVSSGWLNPGRLFEDGGELNQYQAWMSQTGNTWQHSDTPISTFALPESMRENAAYNAYLNSNPMASRDAFYGSNTATNAQGYDYSFKPGSIADPNYGTFTGEGDYQAPIYDQNIPAKKKEDNGWKFNFQRANMDIAGLGQFGDYVRKYKERNSDGADKERRNRYTSEFMPVAQSGGGMYGDWSTNATQGTSFRPDEMVYAQKMGRPYRDVNVYDYDEYSLKKGGSILDRYNDDEEYDLTEEEIKQILAAGGTIEYL